MTALPRQNVQLIVLCSVFLVLAIVAVGLRLITRRIKHTALVLNDYLIVWALVSIYINQTCWYAEKSEIMLCGEAGIVINAKTIVPVGVHDASVLKAFVVREYKVSIQDSDHKHMSNNATLRSFRLTLPPVSSGSQLWYQSSCRFYIFTSQSLLPSISTSGFISSWL